jgi:hypothetical protein
MDQSLLKHLIAFFIFIIITLTGWQAIKNNSYPTSTPPNPNVDLVLRGQIDPELNTKAISLMQERRSLSTSDLANFIIYLQDEERMATSRDETFYQRILAPRLPYDLDYSLFNL